MPQATATPEPPEPDRLAVPVTVWLAPRPGAHAHEHHTTCAGVFALPNWALARLADVYTASADGGRRGRLRLWRPPAAGPLMLPRWADPTAGIVVDLTAPGPLGDVRAAAVLHAATKTLPPGAYLFAVTGYDSDTAEETCGPIVRAAQALGLAYLQHLIVVHGHAEGDRIVPHPGDTPTPAHAATHADRPVPEPAHTPVHSDLLVFRTRTHDTPSGTR